MVFSNIVDCIHFCQNNLYEDLRLEIRDPQQKGFLCTLENMLAGVDVTVPKLPTNTKMLEIKCITER